MGGFTDTCQCVEYVIDCHAQDDEDLPMTGLPNKPRVGTMSKLTATLAARFFRTRSRATVWQMLPLEETLRGSLDQIHFIIGYGLLRPTLRYDIHLSLGHDEFLPVVTVCHAV